MTISVPSTNDQLFGTKAFMTILFDATTNLYDLMT